MNHSKKTQREPAHARLTIKALEFSLAVSLPLARRALLWLVGGGGVAMLFKALHFFQ